jgi:hypothetical protein
MVVTLDCKFKQVLKDIKSQLINKTCKAASAVFEHLNAAYFKAPYKQETVLELRELLDFEARPMKVSKYPPILYPEYVCKAETHHRYQRKIVQSEKIFKVCDVIFTIECTYMPYVQFMKMFLFGTDSLKSTTQAGAQPYGKVWKITALEDLSFYVPVVFAFLASSCSHHPMSCHLIPTLHSGRFHDIPQPCFQPNWSLLRSELGNVLQLTAI